MNNGNSYNSSNANRSNNQNGKSYRGYYTGSKPSESNTYKKNFANNRYNQRPTYDQSRNTYFNNNLNNTAYNHNNKSGANYYEGSGYNSNNDTYYKKPYQKSNTYYNDHHHEQKQAYSNKQYIPRKPMANTYPVKQKNVVDTLLEDTKTSKYFDILARYHRYFKKQLDNGLLNEQDFVTKFEEVKKAHIGNEKLDDELKIKLGKNHEKLKLDKLQYDIAIMHFENIENIKGFEATFAHEINLKQST